MAETVAAIIVTYNRLTKLKRSLPSLLEIPDNKLQGILVIDNDSSDGTKDYLKTLQDHRLSILRLKENTGGAGGFNAGVKYFYRKTNWDYAWVMDDDTLVSEQALSKLLEAVSYKPDAAFYASDVRWVDGSPALMNLVKPIADVGNGLYEIKKATFVSLLVRRQCISQAGLPQKEYFIWGDDMEYTERLGRIAKGYFVSGSKVVHEIESNIAAGDIFHEKDSNRLPRYFYEYRNRLLTGRRRTKMMQKIRPYVHTMIDFAKVVFRRTKYKREKIKIIISGTKAGLVFKPIIEYPKGKE